MSRRPASGRAITAALLLALLAAAPARAALFEDEGARKQIDALGQRLTQLQNQIDQRLLVIEGQLKNQGLVELFNQVELLKADTARLRGQIEVLNHQQGEAQKRQRDLYVDLDSRLRKLETAQRSTAAAGAASPGPAGQAPVAAPAAAARAGAEALAPLSVPGSATLAGPAAAGAPAAAQRPAAAGADPAVEQQSYDAALDLFKSGNYAGAIGGFTAFLKAYPGSSLSPSAQYWIGNARFAQKDFRAAIAAQRQLITTYPDSQKVPDALLNIATAQFELGDAAAARRSLDEIIAKYPQSEASAKARARIAAR